MQTGGVGIMRLGDTGSNLIPDKDLGKDINYTRSYLRDRKFVYRQTMSIYVNSALYGIKKK